MITMIPRLLVVLLSLGMFTRVTVGQATSTPTTDKESADRVGIDARYAQAHLELAEMDLRHALERNQKMPRLYSQNALDTLRQHVAMDAEQLKQLRQGGELNTFDIFLRRAESAAKAAEAAAQRQRVVARKSPNFSNTMDLERAEAVARLARLNVERTRARRTSDSDVYVLRWQVEELKNQLLELQHQVMELQRKQ